MSMTACLPMAALVAALLTVVAEDGAAHPLTVAVVVGRRPTVVVVGASLYFSKKE